jgi:hypothetical protein
MTLYYVLDADVFQAPDLYTLLANRLHASMVHVLNAYEELRGCAAFSPEVGYHWRDKAVQHAEEDESEDEAVDRLDAVAVDEYERLMMDLLRDEMESVQQMVEQAALPVVGPCIGSDVCVACCSTADTTCC